MPDITRIFKGSDNDFEVEIVFVDEKNSPEEIHPFKEIVVVAEGAVEAIAEDERHALSCGDSLVIDPGVGHQMRPQTESKVVVIHPDRNST